MPSGFGSASRKMACGERLEACGGLRAPLFMTFKAFDPSNFILT